MVEVYGMARRKQGTGASDGAADANEAAGAGSGIGIGDYRYADKHKNNPPAKIAAEGRVPKVEPIRYAYSPRRDPRLRFDETGAADRLPELLEIARRRALTDEEVRVLAAALRNHEPWLEWAGKQEARGFAVDPVVLNIHERISAQAIVKVAARQDVTRDLFADPVQDYREAVQFYQHDIDWTNRLILGDSLQVMASLAHREDLAGKVQMIYVDPPYGIKFRSNFQPEFGNRNVSDKESDMVREPETVRAYRDTWTLGTHSYLAYLRDRLYCAKELLADTGSIFVQINDENVHRVRMVLDEVFESRNFVSQVSFQTTSGFEANTLATVGDFLLWYARDKSRVTYNQIYESQDLILGEGNAKWILLPNRDYRGVSVAEKRSEKPIPEGAQPYNPDNLLSQGAASEPQPFEYQGKNYLPAKNSHWKANYPDGMWRLAGSDRIHVAENSIRFRRQPGDWPCQARGNIWTDTLTGSFTESKMFVVQTNTKVIDRCVLMTTDPGDLVLDPTCGSGTTAYVAEQWGRRWIAIDSSRVAISIARQRLLTAKFDFYAVTGGDRTSQDRDRPGTDPHPGFVYKTVPHVTLKSIAQNTHLDPDYSPYLRSPTPRWASMASTKSAARWSPIHRV
jgi:adenine-specific DNA-methyltransferase